MDNRQRGLRGLIDNWIGLSPLAISRVLRVSRREARCVCAGVRRVLRAPSFMLFQHDDGSWRIFPPGVNPPTLRSG